MKWYYGKSGITGGIKRAKIYTHDFGGVNVKSRTLTSKTWLPLDQFSVFTDIGGYQATRKAVCHCRHGSSFYICGAFLHVGLIGDLFGVDEQQIDQLTQLLKLSCNQYLINISSLTSKNSKSQ